MHCSEKVKIKDAKKILVNIFIQKTPEGTKIHWRGSTRVQGALVTPPSSLAAPPGRLWGGGHLLAPSFAYIYLSSRKYPGWNPVLETYLCFAAVVISFSGGDRRTCSGT